MGKVEQATGVATKYVTSRVRCSVCLLVAAVAAWAQTPTAGPTFEVASIKPAAPIVPAQMAAGKLHVGMRVDAAQVDIGNLSLADLIRIAYRVKPYQVSCPDWMRTERFDVRAKLPDWSSSDQVPEMLQSLLAERFKLVTHREGKEQAVYALVVGKNGSKLKEAPPDTDVGTAGGPVSAPPAVSVNREGKSVMVSGGQNGPVRMSVGQGGTMHVEAAKMNMAALTDLLARFVDRPVIDLTELKGSYQLALDLSMDEIRNVARTAGIVAPGLAGGGDPGKPPGSEGAPTASDPSGGSIFASVQQLGLKLEPRKAPLDFIVVDHAEKTPTEN